MQSAECRVKGYPVGDDVLGIPQKTFAARFLIGGELTLAFPSGGRWHPSRRVPDEVLQKIIVLFHFLNSSHKKLNKK